MTPNPKPDNKTQPQTHPAPVQAPINPEPWTQPDREPESVWFTAEDGKRIHCLRWPGEPGADVVCLVHGRSAHANWFDPVAAGLSPRYECVSIDLRGHGETRAEGKVTAERTARDIGQFVKSFSAGPAILVAHSFAGIQALLGLDRGWIDCDLFVIADTVVHWDPGKFKPDTNFLKRRTYATLDEAIGRFRFLPPGSSAHPTMTRHMAEQSLRRLEDGSWTWKFDLEAMTMPEDLHLLDGHKLNLEGIGAPTLVIHGEHSLAVNAEEAARIAGRIPGARSVTIPEAYHHLMFDRPRQFNEALIDFFKSNGH